MGRIIDVHHHFLPEEYVKGELVDLTEQLKIVQLISTDCASMESIRNDTARSHAPTMDP
jgi:hypothetical protein